MTDAGNVTLSARGAGRGFIDMLPVAVAASTFGMAFGVAAVAADLGPVAALVMSAAMFSGAAQFAALEIWESPLPILTLCATVFAVNARHILLGAILSPWLRHLPTGRRYASCALLSDPNAVYVADAARKGNLDMGLLVGSGLALWIGWCAGTAIGAFGGAALGDLSRFGFDAVMLAYFAALALGGWAGRTSAMPWIAAAAVALVGAELLPTGWHIIAGALAGGLVGMLHHER